MSSAIRIEQNISLKDKNWFHTGGEAKYYFEPNSAEEFCESINFAKKNNLEIFVLGEGANILISDAGFDGLVLRPTAAPIAWDGEFLSANAGVKFQDLIDFALDHNLLGIEDFSGIPGNVGGCVFMNIHYFEFLLEQFLVEAEVISKSSGQMQKVDKTWFEFGYDYSKLHEGEYYLHSATFKLKKVNDLEAAYAKGRRDEIIRHRLNRYPKKNTCGSFFRNFKSTDSSYEELPIINGRKMIYVAYYLDKLGIKGELQIGDAIVSSKHANMLENLGEASSSDIVALARKMQMMMQEEFGILPYSECEFVGFKDYPLFTLSF